MRKFLLIIIPVFLIFALSVTIFSIATQTSVPKEARETSSVPTAYATGDQPPETQRSDTNQVTPYPTQQPTNNSTPPAATLAPQATPAPTAVQPKAVTIAQEHGRWQLWTVAVILAGWHLVALYWRVQREIYMAEEGEISWLTLADGVVAASFIGLILGVFIAPVLGHVSNDNAFKIFGLVLIAFGASPFILAGHYNLYKSWPRGVRRPHVTTQESIAFGVFLVTIALYIGIAWFA